MSLAKSIGRIAIGTAAGATVITGAAAINSVDIPPQAIAAAGSAVIGAAVAVITQPRSQEEP